MAATIPSPGYYVVRFAFERDPGVTDSGIILLPEAETSAWANFPLYLVNHVSPLHTTVERGVVMNKRADPRISKIVASMTDLAFLMHPTGKRVKVPDDSITAIDRFMMRIKPLFDEYAMLFTATDKAKPSLLKKDNFGTWADQFLDTIERYGGLKGFSWRLREEVQQDPQMADFPLAFRIKKNDGDEPDDDGWIPRTGAVPVH